jgi:hypothetical protein
MKREHKKENAHEFILKKWQRRDIDRRNAIMENGGMKDITVPIEFKDNVSKLEEDEMEDRKNRIMLIRETLNSFDIER